MQQSELINRLIADRYRIKSLVARGGMANVYLATDERLEREVAVKVIYPHLAENPSFRTKFIQEAKTAARLNHPNLVNVYDQGTDDGLTYMVMEYVPGMTLRDALNKFGKLKPLRALELFEPIMQGLAAAHRGGILHRDLKPENVFLADDGRIKLGDFGLARGIDANTSTGSLIGTIAYLSPELITRGQADARSDVYAAGIMLYEFLTGEQPYKGEEAAHIAHQHTTGTLPMPSAISPDVPPLLDEVVLWATARAPEHRPANAQVLVEVVQRVRAEIKAGRGATARLDLPEFADHAATKVISVDATVAMPDLNAGFTGATAVIDVNRAEAANQIDSLLDAEMPFDANATTVLGEPVDQFALTPLEDLAYRRRKRGKWIALTIALFTLASSGAGWWFGSGPGGLTALPELTGQSETAARSALEPYGATIKVRNEYSGDIGAGLVTRTDPAAGSLFWRGGTITVWESRGPKLAAVPDLTKQTLVQATAKLVAAGLKLGAVSSSFSSTPAGLVSSYDAGTNGKLALGSSVAVTVSLGPLPALAGLDKTAAAAALKAVGLKLGSVSLGYSDTVAIDQVIRIVSSTGNLKAGDKVNIEVSKGPLTVIMPNVIGLSVAQAQAQLQNAGLVVYVTSRSAGQPDYNKLKVTGQDQAIGAKLKAGDSVTITAK